METEELKEKKLNKKKFKILWAIVLLLFVLGSIFLFVKLNKSPEEKLKIENQKILDKVSHLILLPDEDPVIAKINQAEVLIKDQPFYEGSQNGDMLIIFPKAQKAIIYGKSRNIIINAGPFVLNENKINTSKSP